MQERGFSSQRDAGVRETQESEGCSCQGDAVVRGTQESGRQYGGGAQRPVGAPDTTGFEVGEWSFSRGGHRPLGGRKGWETDASL